MESFGLQLAPTLHQFEAALIGTIAHGNAVFFNDEFRRGVFLEQAKQRQYLPWERYCTQRLCRLGRVDDARVVHIVAGAVDGELSATHIHVAPLQRQQFAQSQAGVHANDNSVQLGLVAASNVGFDLLLLENGQTFYPFFRCARIANFVRGVGGHVAEVVRRLEGVLQHTYHTLDGISGKSLTVGRMQVGDKLLQCLQGEFVQLARADVGRDAVDDRC